MELVPIKTRELDSRTAAVAPSSWLTVRVKFEGGDAVHDPADGGTVVVRMGSVVRKHYGFQSIGGCLRDCYGL